MNAKPTSSGGMNPCKKSPSFLAVVGVMQQPTTEASRGNQPTALHTVSSVDASQRHFHPGPYTSTRSQVVQLNSEPATGDAGPSVVKCSQARIKPMKIKINIAKTELAPERVHAATVTSIKAKGDTKCTIAFGIVADGNPFTVSKDYPAKLDRTSELLRDAEAILGRKFAETEADGEFDLETLVGRACQVVVRHRRSNGGRLVAAVETVLPASSPVTKAA